MALHRCAQHALPVVLIGAGLPQILTMAGRSKSYAERMFDFPSVGPLSQEDARHALTAPVEKQGAGWTDEALDRVWQDTGGYPYFLQEWGYHSWHVAAGPTITAEDVVLASNASLAQLDENFFRVRFGRLTPRERDYLRAMADLGPGPHRSLEVAELMGAKVQTLSPFRGRLIDKGLIHSPEYGQTAFSVPLFDRFLKRIMPDWTPPEAHHG